MCIKRSFDILAAVFGLLVCAPLFLIISMMILFLMDRPVFFTQGRVGRNGKIFRMVKLRTMKVAHGGNTITVKGESRITPLGAFLRKYKLDELPEFWNILKGDMSFVGPRPDVPGYADKLEGDDRLILTVRPGLTGVASLRFSYEEELLAKQTDPVKYNDTILFPEKVRIDINYIKNRNFWLDLKIILFTLASKKLAEPWAQSDLN